MPSQIIYSLVARKEVMLADAAAMSSSGNFTEVTKRILARIPATDGRQAYTYDRHVFHYIVESGLTFICMTDENFQRRTAFAFLDDIKRRWQVTFGDRGKTAPMKAMQDEFSRILQKQMDYFSNDKAADKMAAVQKDVDDVKEVMVSNIEKVLQRGEKIELLVDKTDSLNQNAFKFKKSSTALKRAMCMKNLKIGLVIGGVVLLIILILVFSFCGIDFSKCKSSS